MNLFGGTDYLKQLAAQEAAMRERQQQDYNLMLQERYRREQLELQERNARRLEEIEERKNAYYARKAEEEAHNRSTKEAAAGAKETREEARASRQEKLDRWNNFLKVYEGFEKLAFENEQRAREELAKANRVFSATYGAVQLYDAQAGGFSGKKVPDFVAGEKFQKFLEKMPSEEQMLVRRFVSDYAQRPPEERAAAFEQLRKSSDLLGTFHQVVATHPAFNPDADTEQVGVDAAGQPVRTLKAQVTPDVLALRRRAYLTQEYNRLFPANERSSEQAADVEPASNPWGTDEVAQKAWEQRQGAARAASGGAPTASTAPPPPAVVFPKAALGGTFQGSDGKTQLVPSAISPDETDAFIAQYNAQQRPGAFQDRDEAYGNLNRFAQQQLRRR